jgi:hypothetical protein
LGILDVFKKKKNDMLDDPFASSGSGFGNPNDNFQPQGFPDMSQPMQQQQGMPGMGEQPFGAPPQQQYPGFQQQPMQPQQPMGEQSPESMGFERIPPGQGSQQSYSRDSRGQSQNISEINLGKDLELINAKLDAIKSELDAINQRIKRIERLAEEPTPGSKKDAWQY